MRFVARKNLIFTQNHTKSHEKYSKTHQKIPQKLSYTNRKSDFHKPLFPSNNDSLTPFCKKPLQRYYIYFILTNKNAFCCTKILYQPLAHYARACSTCNIVRLQYAPHVPSQSITRNTHAAFRAQKRAHTYVCTREGD